MKVPISHPQDTKGSDHAALLSHPKYRPDIDGLRAVAVLSVVFFHAFPDLLLGGFVGVDIFFVISGFLISSIIFENLHTGSFSFVEFYSRRIRRIFPALTVVLATTFAAGWFILSADEMKMLGKHMVGGAGFISNILLWRESGYFDSDAETKTLLHLWSLGIEEQFYIVWPLMVWAAWKKKLGFWGIITAFFIVSMAADIWLIGSNPVATFFSPLTRFWELLGGSALAYFSLTQKTKVEALRTNLLVTNLCSGIGAALLGAGIVVITKDVAFPGWWPLIPVGGAILVILAGPHAWFNRYVLCSKPFVWIGLISFPLYLWHWPLLAFARIIEVDLPPLGVRAGLAVAAILLAWATYLWIEKPLRFGKAALRNTIILSALMTVIAGGGALTFLKDGFIGRSAAQPFVDFTYDTTNWGYEPCAQDMPLAAAGLKYCMVAKQQHDQPVDAVILGDSHAEDKFSGIAKLDKSRHWMLAGHMACPSLYGANLVIHEDDCQEKSEKIVDWVAANPQIKTVILSFYGQYASTEVYAADHMRDKNLIKNSKVIREGDATSSREDILAGGLAMTSEKLVQAGKRVIILADVPDWPYFPKDCVRKASECAIEKQKVMERHQQALHLIEKVQQKVPSILVYDPIEMFCSETECSFKREGVILYRDSHHLSLKGSEVYAARLLEWMGSQGVLKD